MTNTNLIIALIFAGLFGAALILLALWAIHSYINQRCLDLEHCLHFPSTCRSRPSPFVYVEKVEQRSRSRHRSRSRKGDRRRSGHSQTGKYYESQNHAFDQMRDLGMARPMMQFHAPVQVQQETYGWHCYPLLAWQTQAQDLQQQIPISWQAQEVARMPLPAMPAATPQQPLHHTRTQMPEPVQNGPQHPPLGKTQSRRPYAESPHPDAPKADEQEGYSMEAESSTKRKRRVDRVDYIHICDEYPPIVLEALRKAAPPLLSSSSLSSSSSDSDTSTSTQEVPRTTIPRATPGFADTLPFQFPRYPYVATRAGNTPRSYPRQWMGNNPEGDGLNAKVRYAPFTPVSAYGNKRRSAPSNAHVVLLLMGSNGSKPWGCHRSTERTNSQKDGSLSIGHHQDRQEQQTNERKTKLNDDTCDEKEEARVVGSAREAQPEDGGRNDRQSEQKPVHGRSPVAPEVLRYSPMPIPVVEEPRSSSSEGGSIPRMPSVPGCFACPNASSAPNSPKARTRSARAGMSSGIDVIDN